LIEGYLEDLKKYLLFPSIQEPKPKPKSKSKSKYLIILDEDENNNDNIVHNNNLLTVNSSEVQESNDLFSKLRKRHRSSGNNIIKDRKSSSIRKIDNSDNLIIVASQDFTHLEIPTGNYFRPFITFCKS
jgi:hypothetical protein